MADKFPLQTLLDLSNLRMDESAKKLGQLIAGERAAGERLELLSNYRDEYNNRFLAAAKNGLRPEEWQNYRSFLDRLDEAITQSKEMLQLSQRQTKVGQDDWLNKRGKVKAFDTLAQRHEQRQQYGEMKAEQKLSDEHAARRYLAPNPISDEGED
jgi:flagellar FliJ protein